MTDESAEMQAMEELENEEAILEVDETQPEAEVITEEELIIPENWETPIKEFIAGIEDKKAQKDFFEKFKNYDSGYQKKFQEVAQQRKEFESERTFLDNYRSVEKSIEPEHKNAIVAQYGSVPNYMNALYNMDMVASRDPAKFLINYCQNMGITTENLQQVLSGDAYRMEQETRSKQSLEQELMAKVRSEFEAQKAQEHFDQFVNAKDENGNPKHPYFESVRGVMASLAQVHPDKGLEDLYDMAVYSVPEVRGEILGREAHRAQELEKAKAASSVKSRIPTAGATTSKNWRDVMEDELSRDQ